MFDFGEPVRSLLQRQQPDDLPSTSSHREMIQRQLAMILFVTKQGLKGVMS